jgi:hypothetical protein
LERVVDRLVQPERRALMLGCLGLVCGDSLRSRASSLNADGTPLQFSLGLAAQRPARFDFVAEALREGMAYEERRALGFERLSALAVALGLIDEVRSVSRALSEMAVDEPAGDNEDPNGALWLGAGLDAAGETTLTAYVNARRGPEQRRWPRLAALADRFGAGAWADVERGARALGLKPLGAGCQWRRGRAPRLRIYFSAYGLWATEYLSFFGALPQGGRFIEPLASFLAALIGPGLEHPLRSIVASVGWGEGSVDPKLELCAHCAFSSDQAVAKACTRWFAASGMDATSYRELLTLIGARRSLELGPVHVHAHVGLGMRGGEPYASAYLNPGAAV